MRYLFNQCHLLILFCQRTTQKNTVIRYFLSHADYTKNTEHTHINTIFLRNQFISLTQISLISRRALANARATIRMETLGIADTRECNDA